MKRPRLTAKQRAYNRRQRALGALVRAAVRSSVAPDPATTEALVRAAEAYTATLTTREIRRIAPAYRKPRPDPVDVLMNATPEQLGEAALRAAQSPRVLSPEDAGAIFGKSGAHITTAPSGEDGAFVSVWTEPSDPYNRSAGDVYSDARNVKRARKARKER